MGTTIFLVSVSSHLSVIVSTYSVGANILLFISNPDADGNKVVKLFVGSVPRTVTEEDVS